MQSHWNHLSDIVVYGTCKSWHPLYTSDYLLNRPTACNIFFLFVLVLCALSTKNCLFPVLTHLVRLNKQHKQKWNWKYHCVKSIDQSNRYAPIWDAIHIDSICIPDSKLKWAERYVFNKNLLREIIPPQWYHRNVFTQFIAEIYWVFELSGIPLILGYLNGFANYFQLNVQLAVQNSKCSKTDVLNLPRSNEKI